MAMSPDDLTWLQKLRGKVDGATAPFGGAGNLGLALLANSGYSTTPRSFGQVLGASALQGQQMAVQKQQAQQEQAMNDVRKRYMEAQIGNLQAKPLTNEPNSVKEYQYAKENGFTGSFQEWITAGGQSSRPSSVQEWEFYNTLPDDMKARYLEMKRNPNMVVKDVGGVPTVVAPRVSGTVTTPISTLAGEAAAGNELKRAEAQGGAVGKAQGEITGGVLAKGSGAKTVTDMLDLVDPLIDKSTGSFFGSAVDKAAGLVGSATPGAQANAQLKVLMAGLMTNMPRMEGPQSDADVKLYRDAAGQIGDPTVPASIKKAAVGTIRQLQEKYKERSDSLNGAGANAGSSAKKIQNDSEYDALPSGAEFIGPDGKRRRKP